MNKAYQEITTKIIEQLKMGIIPWEKPWFGQSLAISYATGRAYSFLNQLILGGESGEFLTWNQIQQHKAYLRKGSKGRRVFFWATFDKVEIDRAGNRITKKVPYLKTYTVFSVDDCEGIEKRWMPKRPNAVSNAPIKQAEEIINRYLTREKIELKNHNTNESYYSVKHDYINVPPLSNFRSSEDYYSTLLHEVVHSTGHSSRLHRFGPNDKSPFGSANYSREELVAEMGSSFLQKHIGIDNARTLQQNTAYIQGWLRALDSDMSLVPLAATRAERAVQFVLGEQ